MQTQTGTILSATGQEWRPTSARGVALPAGAAVLGQDAMAQLASHGAHLVGSLLAVAVAGHVAVAVAVAVSEAVAVAVVAADPAHLAGSLAALLHGAHLVGSLLAVAVAVSVAASEAVAVAVVRFELPVVQLPGPLLLQLALSRRTTPHPQALLNPRGMLPVQQLWAPLRWLSPPDRSLDLLRLARCAAARAPAATIDRLDRRRGPYSRWTTSNPMWTNRIPVRTCRGRSTWSNRRSCCCWRGSLVCAGRRSWHMTLFVVGWLGHSRVCARWSLLEAKMATATTTTTTTTTTTPGGSGF